MTEVTAIPSVHDASPSTLLQVRNITKVYGGKTAATTALSGLTFDVAKGEFVAIMGASGSGKTTLLNCISTIDVVTSGHILVDGMDITRLRSRQLAKFRREQMGFVLQDSNLLDTLTGFENIALALTIKGTPASEVESRVNEVAHQLGVEDVLSKYPLQMSGGQKQRVAAARAIVGRPKLVLADEPTGALDSRNASKMLELLEMINAELGATIMMVTHDSYAASFANRVLFIKDGALFNEIRRGDTLRDIFFNQIMEVVTFLGGEANHAA